VICTKNDTISLVWFTAAALVLVPVQSASLIALLFVHAHGVTLRFCCSQIQSSELNSRR